MILGCFFFPLKMVSFLALLSVFFLFMLQNHPWSSVTGSSSNDVCKDVNCGKGICKPSDNTTVPFECECSPGWKQVAGSDDDDDHYLKFLPCVIPNCTLDYSCSKAPAPVQEKENHRNESIFNACRWTDCGGGICNATSLFTHKCECSEGYYNLLNVTFFPCFRECSLGLDCKDLGIGMTNKSTSSSPSSSSVNGSNRACLNLEASVSWLMIIWALLAMSMAN